MRKVVLFMTSLSQVINLSLSRSRGDEIVLS